MKWSLLGGRHKECDLRQNARHRLQVSASVPFGMDQSCEALGICAFGTNQANSRTMATPSAQSGAPSRRGPFPAMGGGSRFVRILLWVLLVAVVLLLLVRLVGSPIATSIANRKLAELPDYRGEVDSVTLSLWRGTASIENLRLHERDAREDDPPLLHVRHAQFHWAPDSLFRGRLGGRIDVVGLELTIVKHERVEDLSKAADEVEDKASDVAEKLDAWQSVLADAFPLELASLDVTESRVRFLDTSYDPRVDIALENLTVRATGLKNRHAGEELPAHVVLSGVTTGGGQLRAEIRADPVAELPRFETQFELKQLSLPACNALLKAYADADVSRGEFEIFIEATAREGRYEGYVKPFFKDLDFTNPSDADKNIAEKAKEAVVSAVANVLKSDDEDKVATKAPFSGNFENNEVDLWTTIGTLLRNAFVEALREGFEG